MSHLKIWHISDTHGYHDLLKVPEGIDLVIHSGDAGDSKIWWENEREIVLFMDWFEKLPIKHKVYIPGNHDGFMEMHQSKELLKSLDDNIHVLINDFVEIEGIKIWGSPHSPSFGSAFSAFEKARFKLNRVWEQIPVDSNIVVTHTPPKGVLDLSYDRNHKLDFCGCNALKKAIININPELHLFGHIHNNDDIINAGTFKYSFRDTMYSNGSVMKDGRFGKLTSNGNEFLIKKP